MILPLNAENHGEAVSIGDIASTVRSSGTFSLDYAEPAYVQQNPSLPAIIQRVGTPLVASPAAQANTPPPAAATGTSPALSTIVVSQSAVAPESISPIILGIAAVVLLFILFQ